MTDEPLNGQNPNRRSTLAVSTWILGLILMGAPAAARAQSWGEVVLHSFTGTDGLWPWAGVIRGSDGNFYGTTEDGGAGPYGASNGAGTVFKLTPSGTLTTLYSFCSQAGCTDGYYPHAGVIQGVDGNLYGTSDGGGPNSHGTVFKLTPSGTLTTLYSFCSQANCTDGEAPWAGVIQGSDGNFYGTTEDGGTGPYGASLGAGTVFKLTPSGRLTTLYSFCSQAKCTDGDFPYAGVIQGIDGNFYGTTVVGGANQSTTVPNGAGTVFKLTPSGTLTTLYSFCRQADCTDGEQPYGGLIQGSDGNFYGTATVGGANQSIALPSGAGTLFKLTPSGELTTLYSFCSQAHCTDGEAPYGGVIQGSDGNFYGTTLEGGANNDGAVFEVQALVAVKLKIEPTTLKFGTVEVGSQKGPKNVTVTNPAGSKKKPGVTVVMEGDGGAASPYSVSNDCDASLAPGAKCTIGITFTPAEAAAQNATLTIIDNAEGEPQSVKLTGKGKAPHP